MSQLRTVGLLVVFCGALAPAASAQSAAEMKAALDRALTFHASFDHGADADFARGDRRIWSAPSFRQLDDAKPGIANPDISIAKGLGRYGDAIRMSRKNTQALFFRAERNVAYSTRDWSGTISFWLRLSPDSDLAPGYADPIQVTDKEYNNAAIWVDFTRDDSPRHFRLGVFGDLKSWNPENLPPEKSAFFNDRTIVVTQPPFGRDRWTNVVITFAGLNTQAGGTAKLYLDGRLIGTRTGIRERFTWDPARATIRVGVNYVGLWDELSLFDRALSDAEVEYLYGLDGGAAALHP